MIKFYSKIKKEMLLHVVNKYNDIQGRINIIPEDNFIQCSALRMEKGKTFAPHKHISKDRRYKEQIAQESWIVVKGSVRCIFYDLDDSILATPVLHSGDASFTLYGGHTYEILEEDTIVYEYKTGPYEGQKYDKEFIGAKNGLE
jgi:hypothetical protein